MSHEKEKGEAKKKNKKNKKSWNWWIISHMYVEMRSNLTMVFFKTKFYHWELVAKIMNPNKSWNLVDHVWHWIYDIHTHTHMKNKIKSWFPISIEVVGLGWGKKSWNWLDHFIESQTQTYTKKRSCHHVYCDFFWSWLEKSWNSLNHSLTMKKFLKKKRGEVMKWMDHHLSQWHKLVT
jgi:hypothetical protein